METKTGIVEIDTYDPVYASAVSLIRKHSMPQEPRRVLISDWDFEKIPNGQELYILVDVENSESKEYIYGRAEILLEVEYDEPISHFELSTPWSDREIVNIDVHFDPPVKKVKLGEYGICVVSACYRLRARPAPSRYLYMALGQEFRHDFFTMVDVHGMNVGGMYHFRGDDDDFIMKLRGDIKWLSPLQHFLGALTLRGPGRNFA